MGVTFHKPSGLYRAYRSVTVEGKKTVFQDYSEKYENALKKDAIFLAKADKLRDKHQIRSARFFDTTDPGTSGIRCVYITPESFRVFIGTNGSQFIEDFYFSTDHAQSQIEKAVNLAFHQLLRKQSISNSELQQAIEYVRSDEFWSRFNHIMLNVHRVNSNCFLSPLRSTKSRGVRGLYLYRNRNNVVKEVGLHLYKEIRGEFFIPSKRTFHNYLGLFNLTAFYAAVGTENLQTKDHAFVQQFVLGAYFQMVSSWRVEVERTHDDVDFDSEAQEFNLSLTTFLQRVDAESKRMFNTCIFNSDTSDIVPLGSVFYHEFMERLDRKIAFKFNDFESKKDDFLDRLKALDIKRYTANDLINVEGWRLSQRQAKTILSSSLFEPTLHTNVKGDYLFQLATMPRDNYENINASVRAKVESVMRENLSGSWRVKDAVNLFDMGNYRTMISRIIHESDDITKVATVGRSTYYSFASEEIDENSVPKDRFTEVLMSLSASQLSEFSLVQFIEHSNGAYTTVTQARTVLKNRNFKPVTSAVIDGKRQRIYSLSNKHTGNTAFKRNKYPEIMKRLKDEGLSQFTITDAINVAQDLFDGDIRYKVGAMLRKYELTVVEYKQGGTRRPTPVYQHPDF